MPRLQCGIPECELDAAFRMDPFSLVVCAKHLAGRVTYLLNTIDADRVSVSQIGD